MFRLPAALSPRNVSAIYVLIALIIVFGLLRPDTFLTRTTFNALLSDQAITALIAVGLVAPLATGIIDLSISGAIALSSVASASLAATHGQSTGLSVLAALAIGIVTGVVTGILITRFNIESLIATLGMGSVLVALAQAVSDQQDITGLPNGFIRLGEQQWLGIRAVVWLCLFLVALIWYFLEHTAPGRQLYAIGGNIDAARLNGLRVDALRIVATTISSTVCALAGVLATASITAGSAQTGPAYLLPAFAAVFLGSTQFKPGQVNAWGTVLAVFTLAVGVKGLQLIGAPFWLSEMFNGVALLVSVGIASRTIRSRRKRWSNGARPRRAEGISEHGEIRGPHTQKASL
ncbi:ribose transport system permease protein [Marmoricola sp. URHA0025 HA25]